MAQRHVDEGRRVVERQRQLIAKGIAGPRAIDLLKTFEKVQQMFEADLDRLLREKEGSKS